MPRARQANTVDRDHGKRRDHSAISSPPAQPPRDPSLQQLAHELNSLLDGSMRCLGMARSTLEKTGTAKSSPSIDTGLSRAHAALAHMAALLARAMNRSSEEAAVSSLFTAHSDNSIGEVTDMLRAMLEAHAQQVQARIEWSIDQSTGRLPAGPLGTVLLNGVRNALEACEAAAMQGRVVAVDVQSTDAELSVVVTSPYASKRKGHHIGLGLSHQIVAELGGEISMKVVHTRCLLTIRVPLQSLCGA